MVHINDYDKLIECIEEYKKMFPKTYIKIEEIKNALQRDFDTVGNGGIFGIEVSPEWEDRCYGFQFLTTDPNGETVYQFIGMTKI